MNKILSSNKFRIFLILLIIAIVAGISLYRSRSTKLLDKEAYKDFKAALQDAAESEEGGLDSQDALAGLIEKWADEHSLEYVRDYYGNIIFDKEAAGRKKNVSPTLIAVDMNYETADENAQVLAAAAAIALSDVESGRRTVVFFNNEKCLAEGYKGIDDKYITSKTKVIYLDKGSASYISDSSFQQRWSEVTIPAEFEENSCDTAIRISISGIRSGVIGPEISDQPDPVAALSALLTRLKSKSIVCGIADVNVGDNGNMYPVSLDVTITLNSYNLASFTSYIDKCIKTWEKDYGDAFEDIVFEYEVTDEEGSLPEMVYTSETIDRLTGILYTISSDTYLFSEGDAIPEGREAGGLFGINCVTGLSEMYGSIRMTMVTQGVNDLFTNRICNDNKAAAELYQCTYEQTDKVEAFINTKDSLARTFRSTYEKISENDIASDISLPPVKDDCFTPCSYLAGINSKADVIHIRMKGSDVTGIANTILCYIKAKGNTSIFK